MLMFKYRFSLEVGFSTSREEEVAVVLSASLSVKT